LLVNECFIFLLGSEEKINVLAEAAKSAKAVHKTIATQQPLPHAMHIILLNSTTETAAAAAITCSSTSLP
jgi:hypothetical protein